MTVVVVATVGRGSVSARGLGWMLLCVSELFWWVSFLEVCVWIGEGLVSE